VKRDGGACLADFGLMSIVLDPETTDITSSTDGGAKGTYPWMSPELFYPAEFGLPKFQLTRESDCYAFGMVIYEVSSSQRGA
jgi:serine/threonine protein kinase